MTVTRLIARPMLASVFLVDGLNGLRNAGTLAPAAAPVADKLVPLVQRAVPQVSIPTDPKTLVRINSAVQVVGALALATGKAPRLGSLALAISLVPATAAGQRFWEETDPTAKRTKRTQFLTNVSLLGGLMLASVDTDGKPGVAWRARRAGRDVRREARHLGASARRETKLAKAQIS